MGAGNKLPSPTTSSFTRIFDVTHVHCDHSPAWLPLYVQILFYVQIYILPCSIHVYRCYKHFYDNRGALLTNRGYRRSLIIQWLPGDDIFECSTVLQRVFGIDMDRSIMFRSMLSSRQLYSWKRYIEYKDLIVIILNPFLFYVHII